jgi:two-component system, sensor histidine kinase ChiS
LAKTTYRQALLKLLLIGTLVATSSTALWAKENFTFNHLSVKQGLSQSTVSDILQDKQGFIWIATWDGLNRYDGYQFVSFKSNPRETNSLSDNLITAIIEDAKGNIWVGTAQNGVNRLSPETGEFTRFIASDEDVNSFQIRQVAALYEDSLGTLWIGGVQGLQRYYPEDDRFDTYQHNPLDANSLASGKVNTIIEDKRGNIWIGSDGGLSRYVSATDSFVRYDKPAEATDPVPYLITSLFVDRDDSLWIGSEQQGLFHLAPNAKRFIQHQNNPFEPGSLSNNQVQDVLRADDGKLWIATAGGGLNMLAPNQTQFVTYQQQQGETFALKSNEILSLYQDQSGLMWIGTAGAGVHKFMPRAAVFSRLNHSLIDSNSLSHTFVWDIAEDQEGYIWFATLNGVDEYDPRTDKYNHYRPSLSHPLTISSNRARTLTVDSSGYVWVGSLDGYLDRIDPRTQTTTPVIRDDIYQDRFSGSRIMAMAEDQHRKLWVSTQEGLVRIDIDSMTVVDSFTYSDNESIGNDAVVTMLLTDPRYLWFGTLTSGLQRYDLETGDTINFRFSEINKNSISNNSVKSLHQDQQGNLWVGTSNGLNKLALNDRLAGENNFTSYFESDGLPNSSINGIVGDTTGHLWLSTNNGLSRFNTDTSEFENYAYEDGLSSTEFNDGAALFSSSGIIYFGGVNGATKVDPNNLYKRQYQPSVVINSINIRNYKQLDWYQLKELTSIELDYHQNDITIEFAALDYYQPQKNLFSYRLLGVDPEFTAEAPNHQVTYTNLDPGSYIFEIRGTNSDGVWSEQRRIIQFNIKAPIWGSTFAIISYAVLLVLILIFAIRSHQRKLLEQQAINEHLTRIDRLKDEFLANTSHELRTPLNGIIGVAESLMDGLAGPQDEQTRTNLALIVSSGKRLSHLVDEILDFKKLTYHSLQLNQQTVDIRTLAQLVCTLCKPLIGPRDLVLENRITENTPYVKGDSNRIQQILYNLVGNAIKFTHQGSVTVNAVVSGDALEISVADTGIGIEGEKLLSIFQPFEQLETSNIREQGGTGLGLAVTRKLVELHGGELKVDSTPDRGSRFYFTIPLADEDAKPISTPVIEEHTIDDAEQSIIGQPLTNIKTQAKDTGYKILVVDDEPVNLRVVSSILTIHGHQVIEAQDGKTALELIRKEQFDLAILDVMMPKISGYDVCREIRRTLSPIDLPVLMLSARNQTRDIIAGLDAGANDYIAKPIDKNVLLARVDTLLMLLEVSKARKELQQVEVLQQTCDRLGRYFPQKLVERIINQKSLEDFASERRLITTLFADLTGFTNLSDRFEAETISNLLNEFIGTMGDLADQYRGVLNEVLGDGLVILFGAPDKMPKEEQVKQSLALAIEMQKSMQQLANKWLEQGLDHNVKMRIGIHQDFATVGNVGSNNFVAYRAIGSGVNLASRLQNHCTPGRVAVTYPVYALTKEQYQFTELTEVTFKGFQHNHRICELIIEELE